MQKKHKKICGFFVIILLLIISIAIVLKIINYDKNDDTGILNNIEEKQNIEEEQEENTTISLVMCGDYLIHSSIYKDANQNAGYNGYDFKPMLKYIKEKVKNYDLAYYNQETILGGTELGLSDYPNFNSPYEAGDDMIDAGFNLVSLATNHTMDSGTKAVLNSREYWDNQKDILAVRKLQFFWNTDRITDKRNKWNYIYNVKLYIWNKWYASSNGKRVFSKCLAYRFNN